MGYHLRAEAAAGPREEGRATRHACGCRTGVGSGYRYYSPGLGRWLNRDMVAEVGGTPWLDLSGQLARTLRVLVKASVSDRDHERVFRDRQSATARVRDETLVGLGLLAMSHLQSEMLGGLNLLAFVENAATDAWDILGLAGDSVSRSIIHAAMRGDVQFIRDGLATGVCVNPRTIELAHRVLPIANKVNHVFNRPQHGLGPLVQSFQGDTVAALDALRCAAQKAAATAGTTGVFELRVVVNGHRIVVQGRVIGGVVHVASAWAR